MLNPTGKVFLSICIDPKLEDKRSVCRERGMTIGRLCHVFSPRWKLTLLLARACFLCEEDSNSKAGQS